jgi:riboflavin synthase
VFTGIVREVGHVARAEGGADGLSLEIDAPATAALTIVGDSVSVSGCCLTAEAVDDGRVTFHAVPETLARTTLGSLLAGDAVNLEPALRAGDPLGGHYVQGHIDATGSVRFVEPEGDGVRIVVEAPDEVLRYCAEKASVAVDGVSLTIASLKRDAFAVALVPHTLEATTLSSLSPGDAVNLEADVLAKYVERLLGSRDG